MSNKKLANLEKMWNEDGFFVDVQGADARLVNGQIMEMMLTVGLIDGRQLSFFDHWKDMKRLAFRQGFVIFPVDETRSKVFFINRDLINGAGQLLHAQWKRHLKSYWYIQGNEEVIKFGESLKELRLTVDNIRAEGIKLGNCSIQPFKEIQRRMIVEYTTYVNEYCMLTKYMSQSGLYSEDEMKDQVSLMGEYNNRH